MKTETKKRIWNNIQKSLAAGKLSGRSFTIEYDCNYQPIARLFNQHACPLPKSIIDNAGGNAAEALAKGAEVEKQKRESRARQEAAERADRVKRLDEDGFVLLAGENTEIIHRGTWRECRDNLWKLTAKNLPRDNSGIGCWAIVKNEFIAEEGVFNRDYYC